MNISFERIKDIEEDYIQIYEWCQNKEIYEWFEQRKLSLEEIKEKYKKKLLEKKQELYFILIDLKRVGFTQIYKVEEKTIKELSHYKNIYEFDIFLGTEYLSKGYGSSIIERINEKIFLEYKADAIILRTFERNIRAIKCYQKCDFHILYKYKGTDTLENEEDIVVLLKERG